MKLLRKDARRRTKVAWLFARIGISVALLCLILKSAGTRDTLSSLGRCSFSAMFLALIFTVFGLLICGARWQCLLNVVGHRRSLGVLTKLHFVGQFFNFFLPSTVGGDVVRGYFASKKLPSAKDAYVSVVIERFLGLLSLGILATGASLLLMSKGGRQVLPGMAAFGATLSLAAVVLFKTRLPERLFMVLSRRRTRRVGQAIISAFSSAREYANHPAAVAEAFGLSVAYQFAGNVVPIYIIARSVGIPIALHYFVLVVPVIAVVSMLPITINGMGVREGAFVMSLGWMNVSASTATAISLLWFVLIAATSAIGGVVYLTDALRQKAPLPLPETDSEIGDERLRFRQKNPA